MLTKWIFLDQKCAQKYIFCVFFSISAKPDHAESWSFYLWTLNWYSWNYTTIKISFTPKKSLLTKNTFFFTTLTHEWSFWHSFFTNIIFWHFLGRSLMIGWWKKSWSLERVPTVFTPPVCLSVHLHATGHTFWLRNSPVPDWGSWFSMKVWRN